jgi:tetratricopeptide (TPR) repeat protein
MDSLKQANVFYNDKNFESALEYYIKALDEDKLHTPIINYNIGVCNMKLKQYDVAIMYFKEALKEDINSKYFFNLGYSYSMLNDAKKSYIYFNMAWALDNSDKDCEKAIRLLENKMFKN